MKQKAFIICSTIVLTLMMPLVACNQETPNSNNGNTTSEVEVPPKPDFDVKINLDEVEGEFDTHTETQNGYLNDSYENIDKYGKGSSENSKPNSLNLSWSITDSELDITSVLLTIKAEGEEEIVYQLDKDATSMNVTNLLIGKNYTWTVTAVAGDKSVSNSSFFSTKDGIVRFISIDGLSNVRDCGGWTGLYGKKIKQGLLYRGEEFNKQNNGRSGSGSTGVYDPSKVSPDDPYGQKISETGINTVTNELKIKTEVDIRGYETFDWETRVNYAPTECGGLVGALPDGSVDPEKGVVGIIDEVDYVICPVHTNRDKIYYDEYGHAACKNFFSMLADETRLPLYFHCAQGKDRTGFLAYLFEAFLGCSDEEMMRDYLLSNMGKTGSVSISKLVGSSANYNYVDFLDGKEVSTSSGVKYTAEGDTIAERAYNYLLECGLTRSQLDNIRATFLED